MNFQFFFLFILSLSQVLGQGNSIKTKNSLKEFQANIDFKVNSGLSIPMGKYRMLTDVSDDRSAAGLGMYVELMSSITPLPTSPWRIGLTLGYMHHPFEEEKSKNLFGLPIFEATSWNSGYGMFGVGFVSKKKIEYGFNIDIGVLAYKGGNIISGEISGDTITISNWSYDLKVAAAIKGTVLLGYQISPKLSFFASASIFYAAGIRKGVLLEEEFLSDAQNIVVYPSLSQETVNKENQTTIYTLNLGLGFRYKFYDIPNNFNYKLNTEDNQ
ncbi:hypothetical protein OAK19_01485 [Aureispira]|nr:hypothetical protein [Aureispira sp.]